MYCKSYNNLIKIKTSLKNDVTISGYASIFGIVDQHNDIITKGAFLNSCNPEKVKLLWQHNHLKPLGVIKALLEDEYGLQIEAVINSKINNGAEAIELIKQGAINGLSIGFYIQSSYYNDLGQKVITEVDLKEISIVTFPANEHAQVLHISDCNHHKAQNGGSMNSETKFNEEKITNLEKKVNSIESFLHRPDIITSQDSEYQKAFTTYLRHGIESNFLTKSLSSADDAGGATITPTLYNRIISEINERSPMRQLASIETISSNALDIVIEKDKFVSGWIGEAEARTDTATPKLEHRKIYVHELYAQPKATQRLIDDSALQIENWIIERLRNSFVKAENDAFINGNGDKKPKGLVYAITNNYQSSIFKVKEKELTAGILLQLIGSLDEDYLANATFMMNRATLSIIQS